jgi:hypothetical protein
MNKKIVLSTLAGVVLAAGTVGHAQKPNMHVEISNPAKFDSGEESLRDIPGQEVAEEHRPLLNLPRQSQSNNRPDGALQGASGPAVNATDGVAFDGVPAGGYAPPDTNMAVGPNHIVQWVNVRFAIYNKSGVIQAGYPKPGNAFWSGFGGPCETQNSGDPIIQYDARADRWIAAQFTSSLSGGNYYECFAVSQTGDPNGAYNRYAYAFTDGFPDYPKITVWKNAYFASYNMFSSTAGGWKGPRICAYDRAAMLAGTNAVQECFNPGSTYGSLLPSDLDGGAAFAPPTDTGYFLDYGNNSLLLWRFTPNFVTPANATLTGPFSMPAASFSPACGGGTCIPQSGGSNLDSLADRLMYRLAYRNFGDHESLVVNHSVTAGTSVGIRWYEIRSPQTTPTIFQQGTYAPDAAYRWMGSAAMDKSGNIAVGYSTSSSTSVPSIRYTGRQPSDPPGTLQAEQVIITSGGAQTGGLSRWGDYAAMRVDPADDCTFWFTTEYIPSSGSFNWRTRIQPFKFNSCGTVTPDFTVSASPGSQTVVQGSGTTYTVAVGTVNGFAGNVTLSATGLPAGVTASFSPNPVGAPGSSTMTVSTAAATTPGSYSLTITGDSSPLSHSTTVTLVVQAVAAGDFTLSATPSSATVSPRGSTSYSISVVPTGGFNSPVSFSVVGLPSKTSASFTPVSSVTGTTLTVKANPAAKPTGPTTLTITGTGGGQTHFTTVTIAIQ